ncbi:MAG: hypothetical protein KF760_16175 [Candidatus Eremiobacteraeota bacterium]|nr:hypothetical protein [Candidatus Eremiobacteraeota bacterium]MCW5867888.1 hypothetical protein [Candidatus Eremiobacteraeota bacterium]
MQSVVQSGKTVEITDRGKVAAVLLSHQEYLRLMARADERPATARSPVGTVVLVADVESDESTSSLLLESLRRRADSL